MLPDYYQKCTLTYKVGTKTPLFNLLVEKEVLKPEPEPIEESKIADKTQATGAKAQSKTITSGEESKEESKAESADAAKTTEGDGEKKQEAKDDDAKKEWSLDLLWRWPRFKLTSNLP